MRADCLKFPFRGGKSPQYDGERGMSDLLWLWELAAATPSDLPNSAGTSSGRETKSPPSKGVDPAVRREAGDVGLARSGITHNKNARGSIAYRGHTLRPRSARPRPSARLPSRRRDAPPLRKGRVLKQPF